MEGPLAVINLGVQLTLFWPMGADYAHHITPCPPGFENLAINFWKIFPYLEMLIFDWLDVQKSQKTKTLGI